MPERLPHVKWPRTFPICALLGIGIALILTAATAVVQIRLMQPLQRLYIVPFLKASALPFRLSAKLVEVRLPGRGYIMAVDPWIAVYSDGPSVRLTLTESALKAGLSNPRVYTADSITPRAIRLFLEHSIFHGNAVETFRPTIVAFCLFFAAGFLIGALFDQWHQEAARRGVQIRGPRLIPPKKAQKYLKGDGIALFLEPKAR